MIRQTWAWLPAILPWAALCGYLSHHWESDPQYAFGWLVPALAIFLGVRRFHSRPAAGPRAGLLAGTLILAGAAALFPIWLAAQPNPDWRLVSWVFAASVIVFSLGLCACAGGRAWLRHFAFPICFILTAIPWPTAMEIPIIQGLSRLVATLAVEILNAVGTVAVQRGNLIELATGMVGVNEACSGVRSIQASLMMALFLAEMLNVTWRRCLALVGLSIACAMAGNVIRATFLAASAARSGVEALHRWHDPAGYTILTASLVVTWLVGLKFAGAEAPRAQSSPPARPLPAGLSVALAVYFVAAGAATEWWFAAPHQPAPPEWTFAVSADAREVAEIPIDTVTEEKLRFDQHRSVSWRESTGQRWVAHFLTWNSGPARTRILARMHRPEICLTAAGGRLEAERGAILMAATGASLSFDAYTFVAGKEPMHVYYGLWEIRPSGEIVKPLPSAMRACIEAIRRRERHLSQHVLELALFDYASAEQADAAVRERLPALLKVPARD